MNFLEQQHQKKKEKFMENVSSPVLERFNSGEPIHQKEWFNFKINSYERKLLLPLVTNETLLEIFNLYMDQSSIKKLGEYQIAAHYNEAITGELIHLIIERFDKILNELDKVEDSVVYAEPCIQFVCGACGHKQIVPDTSGLVRSNSRTFMDNIDCIDCIKCGYTNTVVKK